MKKKILTTLFILSLVLLVFISFKFYKNITNFNEHREYLSKPVKEQNIQDWMTLNFLEKKYLLNIEEILWKKISIWEMKMTLSEYCNKHNLNCNELIINLDKHKNVN